ncbi:LacI family DNA-binding transcriptional regulator [Kineosporia babensis]|uniref:LacI family DNA-binding transcriptional regulator n=1 Tax=Kineosporia babensis TaxID=499548 RepID=UPI002F356CB8
MARVAGVSTAVVSYVLNDGPRPVSAAAKARVLAAVEELNYRPDGVARTLAAGRSRTVGLVVPDVSMPYFATGAQEITQEAARRGYQVLVATTGWDLEAERRQLLALAERRVEALILMSVDPTQGDEFLGKLGAPVVVVDRPGVALDGAEAVTAHLLEHGHRRVGYIGGRADLVVSQRREQGWRAGLRAGGIRSATSWITRGPYTEQGGYDAVDVLLKAPARCTALFAENDVQALGALRRLRELGRQVPGDIAVATLDSSSLARFSSPSLTALEQPHRKMGTRTLDVGLGGEPLVHRIDVQGFELVRRESCGCRSTDEA